jgi:hypothetical protein
MNIIETRKFYEANQKIYDLSNDKHFLKWYKKELKKGYYPYLNPNQLQRLADKIINWYEIKYPNKTLDLSSVDVRFETLNSIKEYFTWEQFLYRLDSDEYETLECNYRAGLIRLKNLNMGERDILKSHLYINVDENGWIDIANSKFDFCFSKMSRPIKIEQFYDSLSTEQTNCFDLESLNQCIITHKDDCDLRGRVFEAAAEGLIYSKDTSPEYGVVRARKLARELKREYPDAEFNQDYEKRLVLK